MPDLQKKVDCGEFSPVHNYVAGSSKCVGMCVDFKFAFHLCLPVITVLCVSLALLTRVPQVTVLANSSAPRSPSASLQGRQVCK